ncbi:PIM1 kinase, partial [Grantiella picta]|nr:PIM1 kinase [Grantiella picta]
SPAGKVQKALKDRYRPGSLLGRGASGSVFSGTRLADGAPNPGRAPEPRHGISPTDGIAMLPQPGGTSAPLEIVLLEKSSAGFHGVIQLLEQLELPDSILMVMERP